MPAHSLAHSSTFSGSIGSCAFVRRAAAAVAVIYCALSIVNAGALIHQKCMQTNTHKIYTLECVSQRMNGKKVDDRTQPTRPLQFDNFFFLIVFVHFHIMFSVLFLFYSDDGWIHGASAQSARAEEDPDKQ